MKRVLVLCTANASRSQMAEGYLQYYAGDWGEFHSAGISPDRVNPYAVQVMEEDNIDISGKLSKSYQQFERQEFDFLITVCDEAHAALPKRLRAKNRLHFSIPDPDLAGGDNSARLHAFREARELVKRHMLKFIGRELKPVASELPV